MYAESWVGGMSIDRCSQMDLGEATDLLGSRQKGTRAATVGEGADNGVGQSTHEEAQMTRGELFVVYGGLNSVLR